MTAGLLNSLIYQFSILFADLGPYTLGFTPSGQYMAVAGKKGHLAIIDMKNMNLIKELQVLYGLSN